MFNFRLYNNQDVIVPTLPQCSTFSNPNVEDNDSFEESSSDDDDDLTIKDLEASTSNETVTTIIPVYCKNFMGVDILPEIPEEDEIEEENPERSGTLQRETMKDSIRRYSQLSAKFEDLISNEIKNTEYRNINVDLESNVQKFHNKNKKSACKSYTKCGCSPYQKYLYKKRLNRIIDFICENFIKPLWKALNIFMFYPCLTTKVLTTIIPIIYIVFVPYATLIDEDEYSSTTILAESTMLLSLIAFPWLCFLVFLPWLINSSKNKLKIIFCLGIFTLGISTFRK